MLTDTLGLVWMAVVYTAHLHDGIMAQQPVLGYLHRFKKVQADHAYKVDLGHWLDEVLRYRTGNILKIPIFKRVHPYENYMGY